MNVNWNATTICTKHRFFWAEKIDIRGGQKLLPSMHSVHLLEVWNCKEYFCNNNDNYIVTITTHFAWKSKLIKSLTIGKWMFWKGNTDESCSQVWQIMGRGGWGRREYFQLFYVIICMPYWICSFLQNQKIQIFCKL